MLCGSDELLGSGTGRSLLRGCLEDVYLENGGEGGGGAGEAAAGRHEEEEDVFELCFEKLEDFASSVQQLELAIQLVQVCRLGRRYAGAAVGVIVQLLGSIVQLYRILGTNDQYSKNCSHN